VSSISLVNSNRKVCAGWDGQSRRFRLFTTIDPNTRKACKGGAFPMILTSNDDFNRQIRVRV